MAQGDGTMGQQDYGTTGQQDNRTTGPRDCGITGTTGLWDSETGAIALCGAGWKQEGSETRKSGNREIGKNWAAIVYGPENYERLE